MASAGIAIAGATCWALLVEEEVVVLDDVVVIQLKQHLSLGQRLVRIIKVFALRTLAMRQNRKFDNRLVWSVPRFFLLPAPCHLLCAVPEQPSANVSVGLRFRPAKTWWEVTIHTVAKPPDLRCSKPVQSLWNEQAQRA
eukprot:554916-Rhodomonas_salina.2